jgi:hypothetical protein
MAICCEDGRWLELAQTRAQWWALLFVVLYHRIMIPQLVLRASTTDNK